MNVYEGRLAAGSTRIAVVVARFNELVTERLLEGAVAAWKRHGGADDAIDVVRVPGAFELGLAARHLAATGRYAAVICLGCVIRGATDHYDYVCAQAASGVQQASLQTGIPVLFGVLTTENLDQALDRAGGKSGNKGYEAVVGALEMIDVLAQIAAPTAG